MEDGLKKCSTCSQEKKLGDFYSSQGKTRSECKKCTIRKNVRYQKKTEAWKHRYIDEEGTKPYMKEYYSKNKDKYASYRQKFKEKNPYYHKEYLMKKKNPRKHYVIDR